jgi:hypothetical protein
MLQSSVAGSKPFFHCRPSSATLLDNRASFSRGRLAWPPMAFKHMYTICFSNAVFSRSPSHQGPRNPRSRVGKSLTMYSSHLFARSGFGIRHLSSTLQRYESCSNNCSHPLKNTTLDMDLAYGRGLIVRPRYAHDCPAAGVDRDRSPFKRTIVGPEHAHAATMEGMRLMTH